jgi:hypothetical protein
MPNQRQRKKKGGKNKSTKTRAMRAAVTARKLRSGPRRRQKKQPPARDFKPDGADKGVIPGAR